MVNQDKAFMGLNKSCIPTAAACNLQLTSEAPRHLIFFVKVPRAQMSQSERMCLALDDKNENITTLSRHEMLRIFLRMNSSNYLIFICEINLQ